MSPRGGAPRTPSTVDLTQTSMGMALLALALRVIIGAVLFYAGFVKAVAPSAEFVAAIDAYKLLPYDMIKPLALGLPWIEMWIGTFLIGGYELRNSALGAAVLFSVFLVGLTSTLLRGMDLASCGCFGVESLTPRQTISMDVILLVFSIGLVRLSRTPTRWSLDRFLI